MSEMKDFALGNLDPAQAKELVQLVELEARWENLRTTSRPPDVQPNLEDLHRRQKAYETRELGGVVQRLGMGGRKGRPGRGFNEWGTP